jgi:hypothetical protein
MASGTANRSVDYAADSSDLLIFITNTFVFSPVTNKMCYETQMHPYEANSRGGHDRLNPVNVKMSKFEVPINRSWQCHKERSYEIKKKNLSLTIQKIWPMIKFYKCGSNFKVKVRRSKIMVPIERNCHKENIYEIWKPLSLTIQKIQSMLKVFEKWFKLIHITYHSKDMVNVKSFWKLGQTSKWRSQGKKCWYQYKCLVIRNKYMKYERPIIYHSKVWPMLKFLKSGSNSKVKITRSKMLVHVPIERSCRKEYINEIWKPYHLPFKQYGKC